MAAGHMIMASEMEDKMRCYYRHILYSLLVLSPTDEQHLCRLGLSACVYLIYRSVSDGSAASCPISMRASCVHTVITVEEKLYHHESCT